MRNVREKHRAEISSNQAFVRVAHRAENADEMIAEQRNI